LKVRTRSLAWKAEAYDTRDSERVDYYTFMKRVARTDPIQRINLLSLRHPSKLREGEPLFPLTIPFDSSPLNKLVPPDADPADIAANFIGPGPWQFQRDLALPSSCEKLHFTNRNRASNIAVTHVLKLVMRVERGDYAYVDTKTGEKKLFDIIVQTPVHILSVGVLLLVTSNS
jgi:hypothetical protein